LTVLALDTATEILSLALVDEGMVSGERSVVAGNKHLEMLLPEIYGLLQGCDRRFEDIEAVVTGTGPGTFSGLRVGIATARALAQALAIPIAPSCTLDSLALNLAEGVQKRYGGVIPIIDARRGQVFTCVYRIDDEGKPAQASGMVCIDPEDVSGFATGHLDGPLLAGGNGVKAYRERLTGEDLVFIARGDKRNDVRAANHLFFANLIPYHKVDSLDSVEPLYIREPDADKTVLLRKREPWLK
jgi:tRNA threonylcarbamoyladenosine biosynthesis protein TsaB